ncbi:hypothetical protein DFO66_10525 [Brevibacterium sanguinis]|uniref:Uncharacterized protein n=3 Tax=Brevibacteriaceae TaxID=85019 RepID=A0A366IH49_9MICO|nr:hypothetical protein DFO66_10525 [Brevibacterium sanguinis]RBP71182.1 hypothetical protein DFO65_10625 [Brevibacterium celere]
MLKHVQVVPEENFAVFGGGWPDEISTSLVDAVYSIRAQYRSNTPGRGVLNRLNSFRHAHGQVVNDLGKLIALGGSAIESEMGISQTSQRTKSSAVIEAAESLVELGINSGEDFRRYAHDHGVDELKRAYVRVRGLGWVTFEYFSMLLGRPGVKADTMICRFVNTALTVQGLETVDSATARSLMAAAHERSGLGATLSHFDHGVWLYQSNTARM